MVIMTILGLAKVVVPTLRAFNSFVTRMMYLIRAAKLIFWALLTHYPE